MSSRLFISQHPLEGEIIKKIIVKASVVEIPHQEIANAHQRYHNDNINNDFNRDHHEVYHHYFDSEESKGSANLEKGKSYPFLYLVGSLLFLFSLLGFMIGLHIDFGLRGV
jgi:hypothetical protein